ncbi:MAG: polysaccharide deacetylase family protein [Methylococcales bacterium]|nr:polysaccharide deacetylase family protein [Methylococcales bacterium]
MVYSNRGEIVRFLYLIVSTMVWGVSLGGLLFKSKRVVLCYHGITDQDAAAFRRQIAQIAPRVVALENDHSEQASSVLPSIVLTFDDAFENVLTNVIPVIEDYQIPISIYVVTDYLGGKPAWLKNTGHHDEHERLMTKEQITELAKNPLISIGSHTHTHPSLTTLNAESLENELKDSKEILEALITQKVTVLAFPHGAFNAEVSNVATRCGLTHLLTLEEKLLDNTQSQGKMGRFIMEPSVWPIEFRLTVAGSYAWLFYFRHLIKVLKKGLGK